MNAATGLERRERMTISIDNNVKQGVSPPMISLFNAMKKRIGNTIMINIGCQEILFYANFKIP